MSGFNMDDYVDVAERIRNFAERFPEGSLQSELEKTGEGWLCKAYAYRTADDGRPGIGHAFEPVPGKTPYTKDSEAMNAETSAWGRAIVALGFDTKKIASKQEVRARTDGVGSVAASSGSVSHESPVSAAAPSNPADVIVHFGKNKGKRLADLSTAQLRWYAEREATGDYPESAEDKALKDAAIGLLLT